MKSSFLPAKAIIDKTTALKVIESLPEPMRPKAYKDGTLLESKTYNFLHNMFKKFIDPSSQEMEEMRAGLTIHTAKDMWLSLYGETVDLDPHDTENQSQFKARIMAEIFRNKISNIAIKDALQAFSSTEVYVLDKMSVPSTVDDGDNLIPSQLPFLAPAYQEFTSKLVKDVTLDCDEIEVESAAFFPNRGTIVVGQELILYQDKDGNKLKGLTRGLRETPISIHSEGTIAKYEQTTMTMFLDAFNIMRGIELDPDGEQLLLGAYEFDVYITPDPMNEETIQSIQSIVNNFKAAGTVGTIKIGLPSQV